MFKKNIKSKKINLPHMNDAYYVFKYIIQEKNITVENEVQFLQMMLKQYLEDKDKFFEPEFIKQCKEKLKAYNE